jgi:hypothetical protein
MALLREMANEPDKSCNCNNLVHCRRPPAECGPKTAVGASYEPAHLAPHDPRTIAFGRDGQAPEKLRAAHALGEARLVVRKRDPGGPTGGTP